MSMQRIRALFVAVLVGLSGTVGLALFDDGGFEGGSLGSWNVSTFLNFGLTGSQPFGASSIVRTAGGTNTTMAVGSDGGGPLASPDGVLGAAADLRYPRFGDYAAVVNYNITGRNANSMKQQTTVQSSDVDTLDNQVHVRFTFAPVLDTGAHAPHEQSWFFVAVRNVSRGNAVLYESFAYADQPGIPWKTRTIGAKNYRYTDWQVVDIAPGSASLAIGDVIELEVIAAGCSQSGHAGWVYVDAFGSSIPGASVVAHAPAHVNPGSPLTYTLTARNQGTSPLTNGVVTFNVPAQTTFSSVADTSACSQVGSVVTCNVGSLGVGDLFTTEITVNVDAGATGVVTAGNYDIAGDAYPALLGPPVNTTVTNSQLVDLAMSVSNGATGVVDGQTYAYTITAQNLLGSSVTGAEVTATPPAALTNVSWTCTASGTGSCPAPSGTGGLAAVPVDIDANGTVTFVLTGTVSGASGTLSMPASIAAPAGATDQQPSNNSAADNDLVVANQLPTASPDTYGVTVNMPLTVPSALGVLANDTDAEGNPLTATLVTGPAHGTLTLQPDGGFTYTPGAGYLGPDTFTYSATDAFGSSTPTTVTLTVAAPAFQLTHVYAASGPERGGTKIRLSGTGFQLPGSGGGPTVLINGVPASAVVVESDGVVSAITPALPAGAPLDVQLILPGGQSTLPAAYTPYVSSAEPPDPNSGDPGPDTDGDGMPDAWEEFYGLDPRDPSDGDVDLDGDGRTNREEYAANEHPGSRSVRYFAEGVARDPFFTWVNVYNPVAIEAAVNITFYLDDGQVLHHLFKSAGQSRATLLTAVVPGLAGHAFGMRVDADEALVINRTITWNEQGVGSTSERAVQLSPTWYFAEGATHEHLQTFLLLTNPADTDAAVSVEYLVTSNGISVTRDHIVPAHSRYTVWVNHEAPELQDAGFGTVVRSAHPIVAERATYISDGVTIDAGETSVGVTAPGLDWYFAEGVSGPIFDTFLLLVNPGDTTAEVAVTYLPADGVPVTRTHTVVPKGRVTVPVTTEHDWPDQTGLGMHVHVTNGVPIVADRAMWWSSDGNGPWVEGHGSAGIAETGTAFAIGDGVAGGVQGASTYLLMANPSSAAGQVRVTLHFEDGSAPVSANFAIGAQSRLGLNVATAFPDADGKRFSATVESLGDTPVPLVVEESIYWTFGASYWVSGVSLPATRLH